MKTVSMKHFSKGSNLHNYVTLKGGQVGPTKTWAGQT